jgi:hypothetical protein
MPRRCKQAISHLRGTTLSARTSSPRRGWFPMLAFAVAQRDWREAAGQILRLVLAPLGNLTGRLPFGNTGRSIVNAFAPMDIPPDLAVILTRGDE